MRSENKKRSFSETDEPAPQSSEASGKRKRYYHQPYQTKNSGRWVIDPRDPILNNPFTYFAKQFVWPSPVVSSSYRFQFGMPLPKDRDVLVLSDSSSDSELDEHMRKHKHYITPKRAIPVPQPGRSPFMMTNKTNRIFKRIATVTLNDNGVKTEYKFYQVPNTASYFSRRDAVVNMTPRKVKSKVRHPLAPVKEQSAVLTAEEYQRIAAERKKGVRRKSASVATNYVSAANQKFAQGGQVTYLVNISHLRASHAGGEDTAENVTITTASHNQGSRRAFIEDVAKKIVLEMGWLNFHCRSDLATDKEGSLTHVAGKLEVSILEREGKSITVELDPQNPESASLASHELATMMFEWLFLGKISQQLKGGVSKAEDNEVPAWVPPSPFKPFAPEEKENKVPVADLLSPKRSRQLVEKKSELPNFASPERRFAELGRFGVFESSSPRALHFPEPEEGTDSVDGIKEEFDDDCSTSLLSFR